jgi:hypothetical protein
MTLIASAIAFLTSRVGMYLIIAIVAGGFLIGIRQQGFNSAHRQCVAAAERREKEILARDQKIGELLAKEDERNQAEQAKDREKDDELQRKLEDELAKRPVADRCILTEPDRLRLR